MKQYELAIRIAQIHHLVDERKYKKALAVIQTLDMHQVRSLSDLKVFAEVYTKTEQYDAAKATYLRIYRRSRTKRVLYRLIYLSIRTNALNEAESYYQEFIRMNPNVRDSLILRYRIDKAAGAPIEQLIEILQQLKQEEYIEEWAYELAKLYHRAGRKEECIEECEDILLWFGTGEIVQRAKLLIEHLREKEPMPYYDDKDFTLPVKEEPNPEDTGSLPDLEEFIREQKAQKREERKEGRFFRRDSGKADEEKAEKKDSKGTKENRDKKSVKEEQKDEFIDDYEDTAFETDDAPLPHIARDGFQIISDLLKFGKKEEDKKEERREEERDAENRKEQVKEERKQKEKAEEEEEKGKENRPEKAEKHAEKEKTEKHAEKEKESLEQRPLEKKESSKLPEYIPPSQSGTGITQDLAREISAIYEMEQREQLQEKQVTVIDKEDSSNIAENVVQRMTNALQKNPTKTTKTYIPIDVEEIRGEDRITEVNGPEEKTKVIEPIREEEDIFEDEMYHEMFGEESSEEDFELSSVQEKSGDDSRQDESGEKPDAVMQEKVEKEEIGQAREESPDENILDKEESLSDKEENISDKEENISGIKESISSESKLESLLEQEVAEIQQAMAEEETDTYAERKAEIALEGKSDAEALRELLEEEIEENPVTEEKEESYEKTEEIVEEDEGIKEVSSEEKEEEVSREDKEKSENSAEAEENSEEYAEEDEKGDTEWEEEETESSVPEETIHEEEKETAVTEEVDRSPKKSVLEGYQAPEIPVVTNDYSAIPEGMYSEKPPTTRALHKSFADLIKLIQGELDPSHFVLMGSGSERMVGVSKRIVRVMKESGYLSQGRIAKIGASQINSMDLVSFKSQLKGNCILIEQAADLLFPKISLLFSIMDEYYGDFVVILADEGSTLDQLFRFTPQLAKRFKYIIDVSHYTPEDYE